MLHLFSLNNVTEKSNYFSGVHAHGGWEKRVNLKKKKNVGKKEKHNNNLLIKV